MKLNISVPTPVEIIAGLDVEKDVGLKLAREVAANAKAETEHAAGRLTAATARVNRLTVEVSAGRASTATLEVALTEQRVAALVMPGHQQRLAEAEKAVDAALTRAKATVAKEAGSRRDELQAAADKVKPLLEALKAGEEALDALVIPLGVVNGVEAVRWPGSIEDDAIRSHGRDLSRQVGAPIGMTYPRTS